MSASFTLTVNGTAHDVEADADTPLLWVLREQLALPGTKFGCGAALCGACTVLVDGTPTRACVTPASSLTGKSITTIEGLDGPEAEAVRAAWTETEVAQCGYCQSGQVVAATALLRDRAARGATGIPDDAELARAMDGNLCRCGSYPRIRAAIRAAAERLASGGDATGATSDGEDGPDA